jgi:hypothetical protein
MRGSTVGTGAPLAAFLSGSSIDTRNRLVSRRRLPVLMHGDHRIVGRGE